MLEHPEDAANREQNITPQYDSNPLPYMKHSIAEDGIEIETKSRRQRVRNSILNGNNVTGVVIPSYFETQDHILYELDITNGKLRWNLWYRFQEFYDLHTVMSDVAKSLSEKFTVTLPP